MTRAGRIAVVGLLLAGCTTVPPALRGRLLSNAMQPKPAVDAAFDVHVAELREGVLGAAANESASCGCR